MNAVNVPRKPCGVARARREIRGRWDPEERRQRRRIAEAKQQALWRLMTADRSGSAKIGVGRPASASGVNVDRSLVSTDVLCFLS